MPLIYPPHDPRRTDSRLFKGGDGGASQMRADEEARQRKVQMAVDTINAKFGIGGASGGGAAPTRDQFRRAPAGGMPFQMPATHMGGEGGNWAELATGDGDGVDEAAFQRALADWQAAGTDASAAKSAREAMYADISGAVKDTAMRDLDRQYTDASRRNKFGLARAGLMGGSVDAESGGELSTLYGEGKLRAAQSGQQAASDLRATDERTRQNLIGLAQSGLDTGTAASMAAGQMSAAADLAKSQTAQASVGRLFDNMGQAYLTNQMLRARYPNGLPQQGQQSSGYSGGSLWSPSKYFGTETR